MIKKSQIINRIITSMKRGFTIIEIMIVLALMAFLTTLAAPGLRDAYHNYQMQSISEEIQTALRLARSEAIRRNTTVDILFKKQRIGKQTNVIITGWQIYTNPELIDITNSYDPSKNTLIVDKDITYDSLLIQLRRAGSSDYRWLRFESTGYASGGNNGRISIQNYDLKSGKQIQIVFNRVGRMRVCTTKPGNDNDC